jgi:predicted house-cleaning noncanonical NTP pyrophosphatase (MazG superfamily)
MVDERIYMKLIRDNIPGIPDDRWEEVDKKTAYEYLKLKLDEEVQELKESEYKDLYEFADVVEVLYELARKAKITPKDIEIARIVKLKERGGFTNKVLRD